MRPGGPTCPELVEGRSAEKSSKKMADTEQFSATLLAWPERIICVPYSS